MNPLQLAILAATTGGGSAPSPSPPPVTPPPAPSGATRVGIGINIPGYDYFSQTPGTVNMLRGGTGFLVYSAANNDASPAAVDANGWPTTDFRCGPYEGPISGAPYQVTVSWTGQATVQWLFAHGLAGPLSAVTYDSGTNHSSVTFTFTPGPMGYPPTIQFGNTKRTAASATNTGLTNIDWRPTSLVGSPLVWKPEATTYFSDFASVFRTMDIQLINHDVTIYNWANRRRSPTDAGVVENIVALANESGRDIWVQIPTGATADWDNNFFTYLAANVNSSSNIYFGYSNETWNNTFGQYYWVLAAAAAELRGAYGNSTTRAVTTLTRASNVVTIQLNYTCDLSPGEQIALIDEGNFMATGTYSVIDKPTTTSFRVTSAGTSTSASPASNMRFLSIPARAASTLGPVSDDLFAYPTLWTTRRLIQAAERARLIFGDGAMLTRIRPIIEGWGAGDGSTGNWALTGAQYYLATQGVSWAAQKHVYGHGGAPYYSTLNYWCNDADACPVQTQQYFTDQFVLGMQSAPSMYRYSGWKSVAQTWGIKVCFYEGGSDNDFNAGGTNNPRIQAAKFTQQFATAHRSFLQTMHTSGVDLFMHYQGEASTVAHSSWGYTDSVTNVTPYWQSFKDYRAALVAEITPAPPPPSSGVVLTVGTDPWLVGTDPMTTG